MKLKSKLQTKNIKVATFGSPRVFNSNAASEYNEALENSSIRVSQHHRDMVTAIPLGLQGFSHVGCNMRIKSCTNDAGGFYHGLHNYKLSLEKMLDKHYICNNEKSFVGRFRDNTISLGKATGSYIWNLISSKNQQNNLQRQ